MAIKQKLTAGSAGRDLVRPAIVRPPGKYFGTDDPLSGRSTPLLIESGVEPFFTRRRATHPFSCFEGGAPL